jgi:predicted metal-dependent phosphotriesterase family hydrolase
MTVSGPIPVSELGITLPHEHVLVDFIGAAQANPNRYDAEEVFRASLPHLERIKKLGCRSLIECTPAFIGRAPALLKRLAEAANLHIVTNTGYYGAGQNKFLPAHAFQESADQLALRWIREAKGGIGNTGIRPGFIKIGVDSGQLSEIHAKLVRAAARTHWATGLTIAAHTGNGIAALAELSTLRDEGVKPNAFIWVHAQNESNVDMHLRVAQLGAWVEFDGVAPESIERHVARVKALRDRGCWLVPRGRGGRRELPVVRNAVHPFHSRTEGSAIQRGRGSAIDRR